MTRWRCTECVTIFEEDVLLKAPNPFSPQEDIVGCPVCKAVDNFHDVCDEPGCKADTSCGFPINGGYRRTCHEHWKATQALGPGRGEG